MYGWKKDQYRVASLRNDEHASRSFCDLFVLLILGTTQPAVYITNSGNVQCASYPYCKKDNKNVPIVMNMAARAFNR